MALIVAHALLALLTPLMVLIDFPFDVKVD